LQVGLDLRATDKVAPSVLLAAAKQLNCQHLLPNESELANARARARWYCELPMQYQELRQFSANFKLHKNQFRNIAK